MTTSSPAFLACAFAAASTAFENGSSEYTIAILAWGSFAATACTAPDR